LFYIDIVHFKDINDTLGHRVGDCLLFKIGKRINDHFRETDIIARVGNDEFLILFENITHQTDGVIIAEKILKYMSVHFEIEGNEIQLSANIGIAVSSPEMFESDVLMTRAGIALHKAKEQGINQIVSFTQELNAMIQKK